MTVSGPISTWGSITVVSGRKIVTPASIRRDALSARARASRATSSEMLVFPADPEATACESFFALSVIGSLLASWSARSGAWARRTGNGDVNRMGRAEIEGIQARLDLRFIADDQNCQAFGMNVLLGRGGHVPQRDTLQGGLVFFQVVRRVAVELQAFALRQHLFLGVVLEKEGVQNVVLGALELIFGKGLAGQIGDFLARELGGVNG